MSPLDSSPEAVQQKADEAAERALGHDNHFLLAGSR